MKIALVHDDLVQWGGAERMLSALSETFPEAPIYTLVYDEKNPFLKDQFKNKKIITSFLQKIPGWRSFFKVILPLHPLAFEQFDFSEFDVVISQTTRFAKSILTKPQTKHICYCHTPPRFLWNFSGERAPTLFSPYFNFLRRYDYLCSRRVDLWVAGSKNAQQRLKKVYGVESSVIYPFADLGNFNDLKTFDGGYLLAISRLISYKRVDLAVRVANKMRIPLKVVGAGSELGALQKIAGPTVEFLGQVDEKTKLLLLSGCKALVVGGEEDFGLTPLEAQACGKPVVAYGEGGALESVIGGETGYLFQHQTVESLISALETLDKRGYNELKCRTEVGKFSRQNFSRRFQEIVNSL
ncbi:MAG: glycosyltransferase [bacterium]|nr:glycosyltransferase [bacterium]